MKGKPQEGLKRISMMVLESDYQRLQELYPTQGVSEVIRALMRAHLVKVDRKVIEQEGLVNELVIDINLEDLNVGTQ